jgi:ATP-dependent RNA helicase DDX47/RRP3
MNDMVGQSCIVFTQTVATTQKLSFMLRNLGFEAICLHGQMPQPKRLGALGKFKAGEKTILICTDVASRGLDIPSVDIVINYDVPQSSKDYIHRVGRTARAGRSGKSITLVSQYDVEWFTRIEHALEKKLPEFPIDSKQAVLVLQERVQEAVRFAVLQLKEDHLKKKDSKRDKDMEEELGGSTKKRFKSKGFKGK